ncbi:MAG TPA: transglycosylase domain-containing protein [Pyrinomonadaceae bacterium]|jgi:monofunctional biosynthetic peptidoglycan transglycosylase|nr:transglycosylase domain-containing protein [Pyrinomonadaceae bacterium]
MRRFIKIALLVSAGIVLGCIAYQAIMFVRVGRLRSANPTSTSLMLARVDEAQAKAQVAVHQQSWVPLERISPNLQRAVLAGEDTNFTSHHGFDYEAIQKAWEHAQQEAQKEAKKEGDDDPGWFPDTSAFKRGGSTISQQLAKNLYLSSQRSFLRKAQEAVLTIFLERQLTKRRILEIYLNVIEWGDGVYGAEAAAQRYFHKPAAALSQNEAAFLSAMIPNPRTVFNPQVNPRRVARRQRIILRGMPYVKLP